MSVNLLSNVNKPAPKWFNRLSNAISLLSNGAITILLALGYKDSSLIMLILKIGVSTIMQAVGAMLSDPEEAEK